MAAAGLRVTIEILSKLEQEWREAILEIDAAAFGEGSLNHWSLPPLVEHGCIYLAKLAGQPVGVAELLRDWKDPELAYLYGLAVAEKYQGQGIGSSLMSQILKALPQAGVNKLQLTVHPENKVALHIYQAKFGMEQIGFLNDYYGQGEDRLLLQWQREEV